MPHPAVAADDVVDALVRTIHRKCLDWDRQDEITNEDAATAAKCLAPMHKLAQALLDPLGDARRRKLRQDPERWKNVLQDFAALQELVKQ